MEIIRSGCLEHYTPYDLLDEVLEVLDDHKLIDPNYFSIKEPLRESKGSEYQFIELLIEKVIRRIEFYNFKCGKQPSNKFIGYNFTVNEFLSLNKTMDSISSKSKFKRMIKKFKYFCRLELINPKNEGIGYVVTTDFFTRKQILTKLPNLIYNNPTTLMLRMYARIYIQRSYKLMVKSPNNLTAGFNKTYNEFCKLKRWIKSSKELHLEKNKHYFAKM